MSKPNKFYISNYWYWGIMVAFTIVYLKGLFNPIYGIDAKIYASISRDMAESGTWMEVYHKGSDYLDKPPLLFWLSALSYKVFGFSSFAYKFPSFLFTILGVFSTYKLGELLYNQVVGKLASFFYYTCFVIIIINQDVRTDTMLTGIVVFSIWQLIRYVQKKDKLSFVLGFVGIGLAMLAKGPLGLMIPVLALGTEFIIKKQWNHIFKWEWLLGIVIIAIILAPMAIGLYTQFDAQRPNKSFALASGKVMQDYSGLKFYFWDQSFGRVFGGNAEGWKNDAGYFFFVHNFLWSFLPWTILGVVALFIKFKNNVKSITTSEWFTLGGIVLPFVAMSMSSFKLPHYIIPIFPFWFIVSAHAMSQLSEKSLKWIANIQLIIPLLSIVALVIIGSYIIPFSSVLGWILSFLFFLLLALLFFFYKKTHRFILISAVSIFGLVFTLNFYFIPKLSEYDASLQASKIINDRNLNQVYILSVAGLSLDAYIKKNTKYLNHEKNLDIVSQPGNAILGPKKWIEKRLNGKLTPKEIIVLKHRELSRITLKFLDPKTREETLRIYYLAIF